MTPVQSLHVPDSGGESSIVSRVFLSLEAWPGFAHFERVMREFARTKVYLAGGVLRDAFRAGAQVPKDFDFFLGEQDAEAFVARLAEKGRIETGPFGAPRWFPAEHDRVYADVIVIARFYNGLWKCEDMVDALNQFDFTANAIALDLRERRLFDPQNGVRDAGAGIMRAVRFDYPDEPLASDVRLSRLGILWIRLMHYSRSLNLRVEPVTARWLVENARYEGQKGAFAEAFFEPMLAAMASIGGDYSA